MHRRSHHASTSISHEWKAPFPFSSFEIQLFFCVNKGKTNKLPVAKTKRFFCNFLPSFFFLGCFRPSQERGQGERNGGHAPPKSIREKNKDLSSYDKYLLLRDCFLSGLPINGLTMEKYNSNYNCSALYFTQLCETLPYFADMFLQVYLCLKRY